MNTIAFRSSALAVLACLLSACASAPSQIEASYVSPLIYDSYTCEQIAGEAQRVSDRAALLTGRQQEKRTNDALATGVAVIVFWPALFLIKGKGVGEADLARVRGEMQAIEEASTKKKCGLQFQPAPAGT